MDKMLQWTLRLGQNVTVDVVNLDITSRQRGGGVSPTVLYILYDHRFLSSSLPLSFAFLHSSSSKLPLFSLHLLPFSVFFFPIQYTVSSSSLRFIPSSIFLLSPPSIFRLRPSSCLLLISLHPLSSLSLRLPFFETIVYHGVQCICQTLEITKVENYVSSRKLYWSCSTLWCQYLVTIKVLRNLGGLLCNVVLTVGTILTI